MNRIARSYAAAGAAVMLLALTSSVAGAQPGPRGPWSTDQAGVRE